ncbi:mechanosensitive ion channel [Kaistia dalseonensis]|uniref:Small-conductance mechanosensitive channel n=1 Tax=Kaistia dalseonensis TaxID=410840 RepID=A0ABU0HD14_9HYPH|nr:mechanosensitive ion channel domain-containing protein [Kaistia dalseonensis]MCX5497572.1 mechanosensitive ion channel [Kaistia dalseonensis]MDQ0440212.1 small-conductance mechanosensitive channel [Kaistia dalseonensis]
MTLLILLLAAILLSVSSAFGQATVDWTGTWGTKWRGGSAELVLKQVGDQVTGRYEAYNGRVEAKASGSQLVGRWIEDGQSGDFIFGMSPDGVSFMGRYSGMTGEWWTGVRTDATAYRSVVINQSDPMSTLASYIKAMNESGADQIERADGGAMALTSKAASVIDLSDANLVGWSAVDYTQQYFSVIDKLTFHLRDLPHDAIVPDEVTATLEQFDTNVTFDVTFRRRDGRWYIVGPPLATLQAKRLELAAARGQPVDAVVAPANLRTPRDTFKMLFGGVVDHGVDQTLTTLDLRNFSAAVRADEAALLVRYLTRVIDRVGYTYWQEIPDDPKSTTPFVFMEHPAGDIVVGPVETDDGVKWQFTQETLNNIRALYAAVEEMPVAPELLPLVKDDPYFTARAFAHSISPGLLKRIGPIERWQWISLALAGVTAIVLGHIVSAVIFFVAHWRGFGRNVERSALSRLLAWSIRSIVFGFVLIFAMRVLGLPAVIATPIKALAWTAVVLGAVPIFWFWIGGVADIYRGHFVSPGYHETLISLLTGLARVALIVIAFLLLAEVLAIPYQGVIAGLGIGGLAVALAAQPTLQNFLSGLTLYADRPVSVGDFCKFGDKQGTIEHIGMRSTRIRSPDRTVISVPNSDFASMQLENFARRDRIRLSTTLQVRYETTADQLRYVLAELNKLLISHPRIAEDPRRVRFVAFGAFSLDIEILAYILTKDNAEFLAIREDLYLRMMSLLDEAGVQLAFPARIEYSAEDLPIDDEKRQAAEAKVRIWREENRLPFPDFDKAEKAALSNRLVYPPEGSSQTHVAEPELPLDEPVAPARKRGWSIGRPKPAHP